MLFLHTLHIRPWNESSLLTGVPGLLIMMSHVIFDVILFHRPNNLRFHLFLYQTAWIYLSAHNTSDFILPPLESVYYLRDNQDLYQRHIANLHALHNEYGLIVWDPALLRVKWSASQFYEYVAQYVHFKKLFNESNSHFMVYLQIRFVLKLLENNS